MDMAKSTPFLGWQWTDSGGWRGGRGQQWNPSFPGRINLPESAHSPQFTFLPLPILPTPTFWPWCGLTLQKLRNLFELGNVIFAEATVLFQKWENVVVLVASVGFVQGLQGPEHYPPCFLFFLRVFHSRDGLPTRIQTWNICLQQGRCKSRGWRSLSRGRRVQSGWAAAPDDSGFHIS